MSTPNSKAALRAGKEEFLNDLLGQLEVLLHRRAGTPDAQIPNVLEAARMNKALALPADSLQLPLRLLKNILILLAKDSFHLVSDRLVAIAAALAREQKTGAAIAAPTALPASTDKEATVDDLSVAEGLDFFVLEMLHRALVSTSASNTFQQLSDVKTELLQYAFSRIQYFEHAAVRHQAAQCVALISEFHLADVSNLFIARLQGLKKDEELRQFVPFQKAAKLLAFGIMSDEQRDTTFAYLKAIYTEMQRIERGVLREEIALTLAKVFGDLMNSPNAKAKAKWEAFQDAPEAKDYWTLYVDIYNTVAKWSRKSKHTLFSLDLMTKMVAYGDSKFYFAKRTKELVEAYANALKTPEWHLEVMEMVRAHIAAVDPSFVEYDRDAFTKLMKVLQARLLPKKTVPPPEEVKPISDIIIAMARQHTHYVVNDIVHEILKNEKQYTDETKAVVLRALAVAAREFPGILEGYNYMIGPFVSPIIEEHTNTTLLAPAIMCFPHINNPKADLVAKCVSVCVELTLSEDREVASASITALKDWVKVSPDRNIREVLIQMCDMVNHGPAEAVNLLKSFQNVDECLGSLAESDKEKKGEPADAAPVPNWTDVRVKVESTCLFWLCHPEQWLRSQVMVVLKSFDGKTKSYFAGDASHIPLYTAIADLGGADGGSGQWLDALVTLARDHYEQHSHLLCNTWALAYNARFVPGLDFGDETHPLWINTVHFLAVGGQLGTSSKEIACLDEAAVDKFLNRAVGYLFNQTDLSGSAVTTALLEVHPSFHQQLVLNVKLGAMEKGPFHVQPQILRLYDLVMTRLVEGESFPEAHPLLRGVFDELITIWTSAPGEMSHLDLDLRVCVGRITRHYIQVMVMSDSPPEGRPGLLPDDTDGSSTRTLLFSLIGALWPLTVQPEGECWAVEEACLTAVDALLAHGALGVADLENRILSFLESAILRRPSALQLAYKTLITFLHHNPTTLYTFRDRAVWEFHESKQADSRWSLSLGYLGAMAACTDDLGVWLKDCEFRTEDIVCIAMYHLADDHAQARSHAARIATALAGAKGIELERDDVATLPLLSGPSFTSRSNSDPNVYLRSAIRYSTALAESSSPLTSKVVDEVARLIVRLNNENKGKLLQIARPWVGNIAKVVFADGPEAALERMNSFAVALTALARPCMRLVYLSSYIADIFATILVDQAEASVPLLVDYYVNAGVANLGSEKSSTDTAHLITRILLFLARESEKVAGLVVDRLVSYLRSYPSLADVPSDDKAFLAWEEERIVSEQPISGKEQIAFDLLCELSFEVDTVLKPHSITIVQNAVVLFAQGDNQKTRSAHLVSNLLHSVGVRLADSPTRQAELASMLTDVAQDNYSSLTSEFPPTALNAIFAILADQHPDAADQLSLRALEWALHATDSRIRLHTLQLMLKITSKFSLDIISRLIQLLFSSLRLEEEDITLCLLEFIMKASEDESVELDGLRVIALAVVELLQTAKVNYYRLAIKVVRQLFARESFAQSEVVSCITTVFKLSAQRIDEVVIHVLAKGLTHSTTFDDTLWLVEELSRAFTKELPADNLLVITAVVINTVLLEKSDLSEHKPFMDYLGQSEYELGEIMAVLLNMMTGIYAKDMGRVGEIMGIALSSPSDPPNLTSIADLVSVFKLERSRDITSGEQPPMFIPDLFTAVKHTFKSHKSFSFIIQTLLMLLHSGVQSWRHASLKCLLGAMSTIGLDAEYGYSWEYSAYAEIADLAVECFYSTDKAVMQTGGELLGKMIQLSPKDIPAEVFNFLRISARVDVPESPDAFVYCTEDDHARFHTACLQGMRVHVFHQAADMSAFEGTHAAIRQTISLSRGSVSGHMADTGVAPSPPPSAKAPVVDDDDDDDDDVSSASSGSGREDLA